MADRLLQDRQNKMEKMRQLGTDPYGQRFTDTISLTLARERFDPEKGDQQQHVKIAGRVIFQRVMGKLIFLRLRDSCGELQVGLSKSILAQQWELAKLIDLGDIIGAAGKLGITRTGEITVWADDMTVLTKALLPPPEKWHGLTDVELRYRQRYIDLFANRDVIAKFLQRTDLIRSIRQFLHQRDFVEVETPMMQPIVGGAAARPFITHHNTLDIDLYMR
ncbi:unnamed protein product, partial [marine sediment metagenome]